MSPDRSGAEAVAEVRELAIETAGIGEWARAGTLRYLAPKAITFPHPYRLGVAGEHAVGDERRKQAG